MASRYYPQKDLDTIDKFNRELLGEPNKSKDGIINQTVIVYKVSVYDTESNMYGESSDLKPNDQLRRKLFILTNKEISCVEELATFAQTLSNRGLSF